MKIPKLIDVFANPLSQGIFSALAALGSGAVPWDVTAQDLDADYMLNHASEKRISPLVAYWLKIDDTETLSTQRVSTLAQIAVDRFGENWAKRYAALQLEYDPIENYSMTETETETGTNTGTVTNSGTDTGTKTRTTESNAEGTANGFIYAYDQNDPGIPSPSDKQTTTNDVTGSESDTESGSHSDTRTDNLAHSITKSHTRSGNIGVTTSQQMLESELELWKYDFFEGVYNDLDQILTIPIY